MQSQNGKFQIHTKAKSAEMKLVMCFAIVFTAKDTAVNQMLMYVTDVQLLTL